MVILRFVLDLFSFFCFSNVGCHEFIQQQNLCEFCCFLLLCPICKSLKIGMTYGDRALLKSYLCPDLKEGSEQVKLIFCTIYRYFIAVIPCLLQCVADNFAHNLRIRF